jgi:hypothetical protein
LAIGAFRRKNKSLPECAKPRKALTFLFIIQNVLRLSFYEHRILALFTHMKTPSLFTAPGHGPLGTLADQVSRERSNGDVMDPVKQLRAGLTGSLVQLLLQSTSVKNNTPGT